MSRVITRIRQVGGGVRIIRAQDARHAEKAREILRQDWTMIDHIDGVDGIQISWRDEGESR